MRLHLLNDLHLEFADFDPPSMPADVVVLAGEIGTKCHGHTHDSFDYRVGATRVVCNPRGYVPSEPNDAFDPGKCIEL